jgi:hypothetical protein
VTAQFDPFHPDKNLALAVTKLGVSSYCYCSVRYRPPGYLIPQGTTHEEKADSLRNMNAFRRPADTHPNRLSEGTPYCLTPKCEKPQSCPSRVGVPHRETEQQDSSREESIIDGQQETCRSRARYTHAFGEGTSSGQRLRSVVGNGTLR